jgi:hypothetical protein
LNLFVLSVGPKIRSSIGVNRLKNVNFFNPKKPRGKKAAEPQLLKLPKPNAKLEASKAATKKPRPITVFLDWLP